MDEWILVQFPEVRGVLIDDTPCGETNRPILVQLGTHTISLDGPSDYSPASITKQVINTTKKHPMRFVFTKP
jgi:hypothetical protein